MKSRIISRVLTPAVGLWLRSQVEHLEDLEIEIVGSDRQILGGYLPYVSLATRKAIYQGLHLPDVAVNSADIRVNLGEILKGKPLRLLEPILISGQVMLTEDDIQLSLTSPLLIAGLQDLLGKLLLTIRNFNVEAFFQEYQITWDQINFYPEKFVLEGSLKDLKGNISNLTIRSGLNLAKDQVLIFHPLQLESELDFLNVTMTNFEIDLGSDVSLKSLELGERQLSSELTLTVKSEL
jgi:hypothetical protein